MTVRYWDHCQSRMGSYMTYGLRSPIVPMEHLESPQAVLVDIVLEPWETRIERGKARAWEVATERGQSGPLDLYAFPVIDDRCRFVALPAGTVRSWMAPPDLPRWC